MQLCHFHNRFYGENIDVDRRVLGLAGVGSKRGPFRELQVVDAYCESGHCYESEGR